MGSGWLSSSANPRKWKTFPYPNLLPNFKWLITNLLNQFIIQYKKIYCFKCFEYNNVLSSRLKSYLETFVVGSCQVLPVIEVATFNLASRGTRVRKPSNPENKYLLFVFGLMSNRIENLRRHFKFKYYINKIVDATFLFTWK